MGFQRIVGWAIACTAIGLSPGCASSKPAASPYGLSNSQPSSWSKFTAAVSKPFKKEPKASDPNKVEANDPTSVFAKQKPLNADFYLSVARMQESKQNPGAAAASYQKALQVDPKNVTALLDYARMLDRQRNFPEAIKLYEQAVTLEPRNAAACNDLGLCLARQGDLEKAAVRLDQAVKLQPTKKLYRNNLATVLVEVGRPQEAFAHLSAAHPQEVAHYNMGYLLAQANHSQAAAQHFAAALHYNPNLTEARQWLDSLHEQPDEAIAAAEPPQMAVPEDRVAAQYDDGPSHQALAVPQNQPRQPRALKIGERYSAAGEYDQPAATEADRYSRQPEKDYEAMPEMPAASRAVRASDEEGESANRPYEARNSGWQSQPTGRY